ncbi:TetR/AcrR family transcriptional regulator [Sciscionella marina]|uniref:TetR/AcrR family transcriptional regulator n=1 Tax=Sciscionella marina TaxID=508770 RepID=UPI0003722EDA|nr:TetR/AcrR family transcriptional regulator [Sciscionella marina]
MESRKVRAEQTEAALKQAARRVFAERGYLNTKITDITAAAGRAAGSFYNHFRGKEEVLSALLTDLFDEGDDRVLDPESGHSSDFTDPAAIRWHIVAWWDFSEANADLLAALEQASLINEEFGIRLRELISEQQSDLLGHLGAVTAAGGELPGEPTAVISAIYDMCAQFQESWQRSAGFGGTVSRAEGIELLTTFVHRGLNARSTG